MAFLVAATRWKEGGGVIFELRGSSRGKVRIRNRCPSFDPPFVNDRRNFYMEKVNSCVRRKDDRNTTTIIRSWIPNNSRRYTRTVRSTKSKG